MGLGNQDGSSQETAVPTPKVIIDLDSNPDATVVEVTFGDRLGALVDTVGFIFFLIQVLNIIAGKYLESFGSISFSRIGLTFTECVYR